MMNLLYVVTLVIVIYDKLSFITVPRSSVIASL